MATTASAVARAHNRAIAKGTDPKAATCRAKLQRARSALNRQMDRELRLREGAENLLRATAKGDGGGDGGIGGGGGKSKSRKLIRQTVALELSFLESNVRVLADELAELNGSVDVYQYRDDEDDVDDEYDGGDSFGGGGFGRDSVASGVDSHGTPGKRRRSRQMPMIAVPLKDTRPIDFGPPLERFIAQHYGVDLSTASDEPEKTLNNDDRRGNGVCSRTLTLREAINELTQLRLDTQTPSRDADGVRLLLRYYRQLYYVDRRFFPPSPAVASSTSTATRPLHHNHHHNHHYPHSDHHHHRHSKHAPIVTTDVIPSSPPAIYFEWYDSFGGPVPSCGQRTVRFEQACVLFNVAAVHTQMGAKHDRRCLAGRDDEDGAGRSPSASADGGPEPPAAVDGAAAATQCFLRAAGAYRHIGDTFANAPARAADLRATGVLYTLMMAQAHECVFEKLQWKQLVSVRHRCRQYRDDVHGREDGRRRRPSVETSYGQDNKTRRTSASAVDGTSDSNGHSSSSWTELAREAAHLSRMYAEVVYNSCCRPDDGTTGGQGRGGKENGTPSSVLPEVWVSVCRVKDRHYAALAYRYAACALLPYYRRPAAVDPSGDRHRRGQRRSADETDADELLAELTAAAAAAGLEMTDDDDADVNGGGGGGGGDDDDDEGDGGTGSSAAARQQRRRKQIGKLLLEAAAAAHDRAARALRMCRQLRTKSDGNTSGGGGLLARSLDRERQRTVRLLLLHRHHRHRHRNNNDDDVNAYGMGDGDTDDGERCCCCCRAGRRRLSETVNGVDGGVHRNGANGRRQHQPYHECWSDDDGGGGTDPVPVTNGTAVDHCSGAGSAEQVEQFAGIAGIPGLDADRGVLVRPRTRFRLMAIAPDFTDTGDGDGSGNDDDDDDYDDVDDDYDDGCGYDCDYDDYNYYGGGNAAAIRRHDRERRESRETATDREERRADLFAGLGPVAVFSARHRFARPRWFKAIRTGRHRSGEGDDDDESVAVATVDPIQLVDRWFGFELRSHGGGGAAGAVPPATIGHVRSNSQAQHAGLRRGDIVVALRRAGDGGGRVLDVRWETCRRVAELVVHDYMRRRRRQGSGTDGAAVQLKVVTPVIAASDGYASTMTAVMDPNKYSRRRVAVAMTSPLPPPPQLMMQQSGSKQQQQQQQQQQRRQRRQNPNGGNDATGSTSKINTWLWNPFRRRRRSAVGNKC